MTGRERKTDRRAPAGVPLARRCASCGGEFLAAKGSHTECRPCWSVPHLLATATRLLGEPGHEPWEHSPEAVAVAYALVHLIAGRGDEHEARQ